MDSSFKIDDEVTNSVKKRKASANEEICKSQKGFKEGDFQVNLKDCKKYTVNVACRFDEAHSSDEDRKSAFLRLMKEAGCLESQMSSHASFCFFAYLTDEQAKKLSGVNHVKQVYPCIRYYCIGSVIPSGRVM